VAGNSGVFNVSLKHLDGTNFESGVGLAGAGTNPNQNEVIIRFMMRPTCNFTSGRRLRIKTFGESLCGGDAFGNGEVIKSSSLAVDGVTVPYSVSFSSSISPNNTFNGCSDSKTLSVDLNIVGGPTTLKDTLYVTLDKGLTYNGNLVCTSIECPSLAGTRIENGNQLVLFTYPAGLSDEMINFNFSIATDASNQCGTIGYELSSQAEIAGLFCSATGSNCPITLVETGTNAGNVILVNAELEVTFNSLLKTQGAPNQFDYNISVSNNGSIPTDDIISIQFYEYDQANDTIIGAMLGGTDASSILASGGSEQIIGSFATLEEAPDGIVAVIDRKAPENCSCPHPAGMDTNPTAVSTFVLPVELISFKGTEKGCAIELDWSTASEENNSHFILSQSTDGVRFTAFAKVDAAGNSSIRNNYKYTHKNLIDNQVYYRLTQVDFDGTTTHFPIIVLSTDCRAENEVLLFPNPIGVNSGNLTMKFYTEFDKIDIEVIDLLGKVVKRVVKDSNPGFNTVLIDTESLPVGTYLIKERESKITKRFVIME